MGLFRKKKHQAISLPVGVAPVPTSVKFRGCTYRMPDHWVITKLLLDGKDYEPWVLDWLPADPEARHDRAGRRRQLGPSALPAAKKVGPTGRVIAIEMSPGNGRVILESAKTNAVDNIRLILVGVSDKLETAFLRRQTMHNNHGWSRPGRRSGRPERVRLRPGRADRPAARRAGPGRRDEDRHRGRVPRLHGAKAFMAEQKPITFLEYSPRFQAETSRAEGSALLSFFLDLSYGVEIAPQEEARGRQGRVGGRGDRQRRRGLEATCRSRQRHPPGPVPEGEGVTPLASNGLSSRA